jgi:hypothetical protein
MHCKTCGHSYCICHSLSRYESTNQVDETTGSETAYSCTVCSETPCSCTVCNEASKCSTVNLKIQCCCSLCNPSNASETSCSYSVCNKTSNNCTVCSESPCSCTVCNNTSNNCTACSETPCSCSECIGECSLVSELGEVISDYNEKEEEKILQDDASIFVYKDGYIHTNINRGIDHSTPLLLGNHTLSHVRGMDKSNCDTRLIVDGDIFVTGKIYYNNRKDEYKTCEPVNNTYIIKSFDDIDILYVNPSLQPVVVLFDIDTHFRANYRITIKDISLNHPTSHNVYIKIMQHSNKVQLQHYFNINEESKIMNSFDGVYLLNTAGGAVTYRYCQLPDPVFLIESEFKGNERVAPGLTFG